MKFFMALIGSLSISFGAYVENGGLDKGTIMIGMGFFCGAMLITFFGAIEK